MHIWSIHGMWPLPLSQDALLSVTTSFILLIYWLYFLLDHDIPDWIDWPPSSVLLPSWNCFCASNLLLPARHFPSSSSKSSHFCYPLFFAHFSIQLPSLPPSLGSFINCRILHFATHAPGGIWSKQLFPLSHRVLDWGIFSINTTPNHGGIVISSVAGGLAPCGSLR